MSEQTVVKDELADVRLMQKAAAVCEGAAHMSEKLASAEEKIKMFDEGRAAFIKKATHAAKVLAGRGAIDNDKVNEFVDKVAEDPSSVWEVVEKMAETISAPTLGEPSGFVASRGVDDPWLKMTRGDRSGNGYVD